MPSFGDDLIWRNEKTSIFATMKHLLSSLFEQHFGSAPTVVSPLSGSASNRQYFRLQGSLASGQSFSAIGVVGEDARENHSFLTLASQMRRRGIRVPEVLAQTEDGMCYLQEDLGRTSLYDLIAACQKRGEWDAAMLRLLHGVMWDLPKIQFQTPEGYDFGNCYRESRFCPMVIRWDLNYFKYSFLKPVGVVLDEIRLQAEFDVLERNLMSIFEAQSRPTFLYRDFQSRNVMVRQLQEGESEPCYIDFQAGYEGPFYYDVASFLWQARAAYPEEIRQSLLRTYWESLLQYCAVTWEEFCRNLNQFVLFRLLQVLGAYGFRGLFERKAMFLSPISLALQSVTDLFASHTELQELFPYIHSLLAGISQSGRFSPSSSEGPLVVRITSFSYKKGIPEDNSGNGGGFVFDCRAPHNPGRYKEYKKLTGLQQPVIDFLEDREEAVRAFLGDERYAEVRQGRQGTELNMIQFMAHVYALVDPAVATYRSRGFTSVVVNFGCTGGQHRSVYGAQHLAEHLKQKFSDVQIHLTHREQGIQQIL